MASSRSLVLLLLAACLCATVSANRVVPTSMKLEGPVDLEIVAVLSVGLTVDLSHFKAGQVVIVTVEKAVGGPAVFTLVGGKVSKVLYVKVNLDPLDITINIDVVGLIKKNVVVPLEVLDPVLGEITGLVKEVKGVLVVVPILVKGVLKALSVANGVGTLIATVLP